MRIHEGVLNGRRAAAAAVVVGLASICSNAFATTPRDYFLNAPPAGTDLLLDAYTVGAQLSLENRAHLEEGMSMVTSRISGIFSLPYKDVSANVDIRVFLFTLGGSVGIRDVHRDHTLVPGEDFNGDGLFDDKDVNTREVRSDREAEGLQGSQTFPYYEGRLRLVIPLDSFFWSNLGTIRGEDRNDNSFDWFHAFPHDGGTLYRYDSTLFFRHRDFGAIGPTFRYIDAQEKGERNGRVNYGLVYGTRPGLIKKDLFLFQSLFQLGDDEFGLHGYKIPAYLLAVYRAAISL